MSDCNRCDVVRALRKGGEEPAQSEVEVTGHPTLLLGDQEQRLGHPAKRFGDCPDRHAHSVQ